MDALEVYAEVCCPFTHFGLRRIVEERSRRGADLVLRVHAWPLEWVNGKPLDPGEIAEEVRALRASVAPDLFTGFDPTRFPATSMPAFGLVSAAYDVDAALGERASLRVREALFEEGRDIGEEAEISALATELGVEVPSPEIAEERVRSDWEEGQTRGVIGSPHFIVAGAGDFFCPALEIRKQAGGDLRVETDAAALDVFLDAVFA